MDEWHPTSDEELENKQAYCRRGNSILAIGGVGSVIAGFVLGAILQIQVHYSFASWPKPLRFLTTPPGMVLVLLALFAVIYKSTKYGRRAEAFRPYSRVITNYNRGRQAYELWKKKGKNRDLQRCRQFLQAARWCLKDVPEFEKLWKEVEQKSGMDSASQAG